MIRILAFENINKNYILSYPADILLSQGRISFVVLENN